MMFHPTQRTPVDHTYTSHMAGKLSDQPVLAIDGVFFNLALVISRSVWVTDMMACILFEQAGFPSPVSGCRL